MGEKCSTPEGCDLSFAELMATGKYDPSQQDLRQKNTSKESIAEASRRFILDLHNLNLQQAEQALVKFINTCRSNRARVAIIITGKGNRSWKGKAKIRPMVSDQLEKNRKRWKVGKVEWSQKQEEESGSVKVYLKY